MNDTSDRPEQPARHRRPHIVVGVDGSPDSVAALKAGAWAAAARGGTLTAVIAWAAPLIYGGAPLVLPEARAEAEERLRTALPDGLGANPLVPVDTLITPETPTAALVEASRDADLVVVGSRGHGGFAGLLIGSVSMACTMHARCPVLVVHHGAALTESQEARSGARVVVGVGDGPGAIAVLRTAAQAAQELDAELLAVAAWHHHGRIFEGRPELREEARRTAEHTLERQIAAAFLHGRPPRLHTEVREGSPAAVLVEASRTADIVVVGRAGHSQWAGVLLGSVSLPVVEHADCPVLVVPGTAVAEDENVSGHAGVAAAAVG